MSYSLSPFSGLVHVQVSHQPWLCDYLESAVGLSGILQEVWGCSKGLDLSCWHVVGSSLTSIPWPCAHLPFNSSFLTLFCISWTWLSKLHPFLLVRWLYELLTRFPLLFFLMVSMKHGYFIPPYLSALYLH